MIRPGRYPPGMAIYPIRTFGDPVLRTRATPVDEITSSIRTLVDDMIETMYDAPGVGLAAPQIGVSKRVFVFDAGFGPRTVINPEPVEVTSERVAVELNLEILPKDQYDTRQLMDGDRVEVVAFVGGG